MNFTVGLRSCDCGYAALDLGVVICCFYNFKLLPAAQIRIDNKNQGAARLGSGIERLSVKTEFKCFFCIRKK